MAIEDVDENEELDKVVVKIPQFEAFIEQNKNTVCIENSQASVSNEEEKEGAFMKKMSLKFGFKLDHELVNNKTPDPNTNDNSDNFGNVKISKF